MFVFLHFIVLGSSERQTASGETFFSQMIVNPSEHKPKSARRWDSVAITQQQQQRWCYHYKTHTKFYISGSVHRAS
jgi:hypothetical protein